MTLRVLGLRRFIATEVGKKEPPFPNHYFGALQPLVLGGGNPSLFFSGLPTPTPTPTLPTEATGLNKYTSSNHMTKGDT